MDGTTTPVDRAFLARVTQVEEQFHTLLDLLKDRIGTRYGGLTGAQVLMILRMPEGECYVQKIGTPPVYFGSNPNYNVRKLAKFGLIEKQRGGADRRRMYYELTDKGRRLRADYATMIASLPPELRATLMR